MVYKLAVLDYHDVKQHTLTYLLKKQRRNEKEVQNKKPKCCEK